MKSITIQGTKREIVGKKASKQLRNAEQVPCVVYGGEQPIHFAADEKSFKSLVYTPEAHTVVLDINGQNVNAILQDIQFHPITDRIIHADFAQLFDDKAVTIAVPVKLTGRSKGVANGGALRHNMRKVTVKALPGNLPDDITVDITPLKIGSKLYIKALRNDKFELLHPDNAVVVAVRASRASILAGGGAADDEDEDEEVEVAEDAAEVQAETPAQTETQEDSAE
ncbi:MAG: 50S ribosomal protein L25 [Flavobacteriaceae bacterium]|nr:MAG: 50S ribosomal protein L25 [Flavobacteriaceae bacterium]